MSARDLLRRLLAGDAVITVNGDRLHIDAPEGAIDDLMVELRAHKLELLRLLADHPPCSGCRNLRMAEVPAPGLLPPYRFTWFCSKGHLEHGHTLPDLRLLRAPDACIALDDHKQAFANERKTATRN